MVNYRKIKNLRLRQTTAQDMCIKYLRDDKKHDFWLKVYYFWADLISREYKIA